MDTCGGLMAGWCVAGVADVYLCLQEGQECSNAVQVYVASVRIRNVHTDMVISLNWYVRLFGKLN